MTSWQDWWYPNKKRDLNYTLRFKIVFDKKENFINCFPKEMQEIAEKHYERLLLNYGDTQLAGQTENQVKGLLMTVALKQLTEYNYLKNLPENANLYASNKDERSLKTEGSSNDTGTVKNGDKTLLYDNAKTTKDGVETAVKYLINTTDENGNSSAENSSSYKNDITETRNRSNLDFKDFDEFNRLKSIDPEFLYIEKTINEIINPIQNGIILDEWKGY